jgi:hypothetical protein
MVNIDFSVVDVKTVKRGLITANSKWAKLEFRETSGQFRYS